MENITQEISSNIIEQTSDSECKQYKCIIYNCQCIKIIQPINLGEINNTGEIDFIKNVIDFIFICDKHQKIYINDSIISYELINKEKHQYSKSELYKKSNRPKFKCQCNKSICLSHGIIHLTSKVHRTNLIDKYINIQRSLDLNLITLTKNKKKRNEIELQIIPKYENRIYNKEEIKELINSIKLLSTEKDIIYEIDNSDKNICKREYLKNKLIKITSNNELCVDVIGIIAEYVNADYIISIPKIKFKPKIKQSSGGPAIKK
jgi:hypothetical protein